ncbi:beta/gamma crystallin-related protein [Brevundimonas sp.]|uniref:beta/gamma crystallin-related protein n=1 Tax=Brevundimonas sp. TaxID=1871086 RepID=UPI0025B9C054|nr:beta/gamma crystallin-related protein [Brevundimonas sp.]
MMILTAVAMATTLMAPAQQRGPQNHYNDRAPRGSYSQTCSNVSMNQGRLYAECRDMRGQTRGTSIEANRCGQADIANDNGLLICGNIRGSYTNNRPGRNNGGGWNNGGNNGGGWGGGRDSITVYRDANFRGASTRFDGEMANLDRTGFNDAISSMQMRGRWEVCTDAYFRGNCQVLDGDVRNLDRWGLNDRISSMRPVRGGGRW